MHGSLWREKCQWTWWLAEPFLTALAALIMLSGFGAAGGTFFLYLQLTFIVLFTLKFVRSLTQQCDFFLLPLPFIKPKMFPYDGLASLMLLVCLTCNGPVRRRNEDTE